MPQEVRQLCIVEAINFVVTQKDVHVLVCSFSTNLLPEYAMTKLINTCSSLQYIYAHFEMLNKIWSQFLCCFHEILHLNPVALV